MPQYPKSLLEEELKRGEYFRKEWPWRLLVFMIIIFGMTILISAGMNLGYQPYLNSQLKSLDQKVADLNKEIESEQPKALINLYSQLINIERLLDAHSLPSKLLALLEKNTDERVYYLNLSFSAVEKNLKLEGIAADYNSLVRQMELFRRRPEVKAIFLDDSHGRDQGDIQFTLRLILSPETFK